MELKFNDGNVMTFVKDSKQADTASSECKEHVARYEIQSEDQEEEEAPVLSPPLAKKRIQ
jgi:hypothetical protein